MLKTIGFTIVLLSLISGTSFAASNNIRQILENDSINVSSDKDEVLIASEKYKNDVKRLLSESNKVDVAGIKTDSFIKAYKLNTQNIVSEYKNLKSFDKIVSNKYGWLSPIVDKNNKIVSILTLEKGISVVEFNKLPIKYDKDSDKAEALEKVKENEGKWIVAKIGPTLSEDQADFLIDKSKIENLLTENNISTVSQIKFVLADSHFTNILYIKSGNDEYGVPFGARPDLTGLQNGKLYKISDLITTLDKSFPSTKGDDLGGGSSTTVINNQSIIIIVISVILLTSVCALAINKKFRENK